MSNQELMEPKLEVIIPVKDRAELKLCVESLFIPKSPVTKIIICDGGSTDNECVAVLNELSQLKNIKIFKFPSIDFNKARLINNGIMQDNNNVLLISDADIIWNLITLEVLLNSVLSSCNRICLVRDVEESQPNSIALKRARYTYEIHIDDDVSSINIVPVSNTNLRPGCGLICAKKTTLLELGGYKEVFSGWGWEDQDLLIRSQLLGMQVCAEGKVIHISHPDQIRNRYNGNLTPSQTRDANIILSSQLLAQGNITGNLLPFKTSFLKPNKIKINLPTLLECTSSLEKK